MHRGHENDYERFSVGDKYHLLVGLDLSPDQKTIAISSVQKNPLILYDWEKREITAELDVGDMTVAGSIVRYSPAGKYMVLQQTNLIDWAPNKDKEVSFDVVESSSGKKIKHFDAKHAVVFTPDDKYILALSGETVELWNLTSGSMDKSFSVPMASNGIAVSPDGKSIAVSHHVDGDALKKNPRFKKNKTLLKTTEKYKQQVSIFDAATFDMLKTVAQFYDIVYRLEYSPDGSKLFVLEIPHVKAQSAQQRTTYVETIDAANYEPLRMGFTSTAPYEPDFKLSHNGKLFGIVSKGNRYMELHIYDFNTGTMLKRFEESYRLFEKNEGEIIAADARSSFVFLPDDQSVIMTMGNRLIKWNLNLNE